MSVKENQNAFKHGGEGAIKNIQAQKPFIGEVFEEQKVVEADLAMNGIESIMRVNAIRLQTALNMYWNAVTKVAQEGDIPTFDKYIARFGWLSGCALREWDQIQKSERDAAKSGPNVIDVVNAMKGGDNG